MNHEEITISDMENKKEEKIKTLFNQDEVKKDNLIYYYLNKEKYCCDIDLNPLFKNIKIYDYLRPIKDLSEYYKDCKPNYYKELYNKYQNTKIEAPIYIKDFDYDMDEILLQYMKCQNNSSILIVWPISNIKSIEILKQSHFYSKLESNGQIHAIKEINISRKQVQGMIYQIYYDKSGFKTMQGIKGKQAKGKANEYKNKFFIIFYQPKNHKEISGTDAPFKIELREILKKNSQENVGTKLNYFLHITDNLTQVIELSQLFCNKNSMRLLQYDRLDRILYKDYQRSLVMLMTFKNWLYQNIETIDQNKFIIFSSIVLYTLGLRNINDLDMILLDYPDNPKTKDFNKKIKKFLIEKESRFPFLEVTIKKKGVWFIDGELQDYKAEWFDNEWPKMYGSATMDDTILNPRFHYYYFGIKIISMIADFQRRIKRSRPAAYADLIAIMKFTNQTINIPKLPDGYWKNHVYYNFNEKEKMLMYKKIRWYLRTRYELKINITEIKNYFQK